MGLDAGPVPHFEMINQLHFGDCLSGLQLSKVVVLFPELLSVVLGVSLICGEAFQLQAQPVLFPEALLAWIPLGSLWKCNPPLSPSPDHSHWAQELSPVQTLQPRVPQMLPSSLSNPWEGFSAVFGSNVVPGETSWLDSS
jgi:hypothetical protein